MFIITYQFENRLHFLIRRIEIDKIRKFVENFLRLINFYAGLKFLAGENLNGKSRDQISFARLDLQYRHKCTLLLRRNANVLCATTT